MQPTAPATTSSPAVDAAASRRTAWVDLLRALAVLLVVLEHAVILPGELLPAHLQALGSFFLPFRMPTLMLLSGMLVAHSLRKGPAAYLRGKLSRIAWPFLVWTAVLVVVQWITGDDAGLTAEPFWRPDGPLFFLQHLLAYYLVALVLPPLARSAAVVPLLVAAGFAHDHFAAERFLFLFAFFLLGDVLSRHLSVLPRLVDDRRVVAACALLAVGAGTYALLGGDVRYNALFAWGTAAGIVAAVAACRRLAETRPGAWLAGYGKHTIIYYVASWPAQLVAWKLMVREGVPEAHVVVLVLVAVGVAAGHVLLVSQRRVPLVERLFDLSPRRRAPQRLQTA